MTPHQHDRYVEGCYRCDLSADEVEHDTGLSGCCARGLCGQRRQEEVLAAHNGSRGVNRQSPA